MSAARTMQQSFCNFLNRWVLGRSPRVSQCKIKILVRKNVLRDEEEQVDVVCIAFAKIPSIINVPVSCPLRIVLIISFLPIAP